MGYRTLFEASGIHNSNSGLQITRDMYINGFFTLLFNFTPDRGASSLDRTVLHYTQVYTHGLTKLDGGGFLPSIPSQIQYHGHYQSVPRLLMRLGVGFGEPRLKTNSSWTVLRTSLHYTQVYTHGGTKLGGGGCHLSPLQSQIQYHENYESVRRLVMRLGEGLESKAKKRVVPRPYLEPSCTGTRRPGGCHILIKLPRLKL